MTERRSVWGTVADLWDPERDPAQQRMRDALALGSAPQPVQDAPGAAEPLVGAPVATRSYRAPQRPSKRERIAELVRRVKAGDLSAVDLLRRALGEDR